MHWMGLAFDLEYLNPSVCTREGWNGQGAVVKAIIGVKVEGTLSKVRREICPLDF